MQTAWETAALPGAPAGACRVGACSSGKCQRKPYFFQIIPTLSLYFLSTVPNGPLYRTSALQRLFYSFLSLERVEAGYCLGSSE